VSLWMRWLDFRALRDLLLLIGERPQGLGASELEKLATAEGVLLRRDGRPYARSIHYHHRRTLERLGLIEKHGARFALSRRNPEIRALNAPTRIGEPLQPEEKEAFANSALRNEDCHQVFFSHFLPAREPVADVATFVERGHAVEVAVRSRIAREAGARGGEGQHRGRNRSKRVAIRAVEAGDWAAFDGAEAVQAIHFGLRSWCVDQLGFLDVAFRPDGTYAILIITARRQRNAWIFPVGTVDPGETLEQAAARECMEESGYTVRTGPLLKALDLTSKNGLRRFSFFAAQVTGEVDEYETDRRRRWVPLTQLVDTVSEAFAPVARAARAYLSA